MTVGDLFGRLRQRGPESGIRMAAAERYRRLGYEVKDLGADLLLVQHSVAVLVRFHLDRQATEADIAQLEVDAATHVARRCVLFAADLSDPARRRAAAEGVELVGREGIRSLRQAWPAA